MMGYEIVGIDIRDFGYKHPNFTFLKDDFITHKFAEKFDVIIDISAIEHFGLNYYGSLKPNKNADTEAIRKVFSLLKTGGQFIFTAPCGRHEIIGTFERIYDRNDLKSLLDKFKLLNIEFYKVTNHSKIDMISESEAMAMRYNNDCYSVVLINAKK